MTNNRRKSPGVRRFISPPTRELSRSDIQTELDILQKKLKILLNTHGENIPVGELIAVRRRMKELSID